MKKQTHAHLALEVRTIVAGVNAQAGYARGWPAPSRSHPHPTASKPSYPGTWTAAFSSR